MDIQATFKKALNYNGVSYNANDPVPEGADLPMLRFWYQRGRIEVSGADAILVTSKKLEKPQWGAEEETKKPSKKTSKAEAEAKPV